MNTIFASLHDIKQNLFCILRVTRREAAPRAAEQLSNAPNYDERSPRRDPVKTTQRRLYTRVAKYPLQRMDGRSRKKLEYFISFIRETDLDPT